jgi:allantoinase
MRRAGRTFIEGSFRPAGGRRDRRQADRGHRRPARARSSLAARTVLVPDDAVLLPGLVDSHVHVNEPGRTEWEGFRSATLAAAAGGVTTIVDMPLNSLPPRRTTRRRSRSRGPPPHRRRTSTSASGAARCPTTSGRSPPLHEAGVFGFKCFLSPSGVDEFPHLDREQLGAAMEEVAALGSRLIVHAEDPPCWALWGRWAADMGRSSPRAPPPARPLRSTR